MFNFLILLFSNITLMSAFMVIVSLNPVHSVLFLILAFVNTAFLLFLFGAEFLAIIFIIVYVGAIAVLFLFVVMMLNIKLHNWQNFFWTTKFFNTFLITGFATTIYLLLPDNFLPLSWKYNNLVWINWFNTTYKTTQIEAIGTVLYTHYDFFFALCGLILLVSMVNAILLTLNMRSKSKKQKINDQMSHFASQSVRFIHLEIK